MYKQKLIALLKVLEVQEIDELIEKPVEHLIAVGFYISKAAQKGTVPVGTKNRCHLCRGTGIVPGVLDVEEYYEEDTPPEEDLFLETIADALYSTGKISTDAGTVTSS